MSKLTRQGVRDLGDNRSRRKAPVHPALIPPVVVKRECQHMRQRPTKNDEIGKRICDDCGTSWDYYGNIQLESQMKKSKLNVQQIEGWIGPAWDKTEEELIKEHLQTVSTKSKVAKLQEIIWSGKKYVIKYYLVPRSEENGN